MGDKCTSKRIKECAINEKKKYCNPKTGRCITNLKIDKTKSDKPKIDKPKDDKPKDDEVKYDKTKSDNEVKHDIKTKKTIRQFIQEDIQKYDTFEKLIERTQTKKQDIEEENIVNQLIKIEGQYNKSKKGFIYERVWDICVKLGATDFTPNINNDKEEYYYEHGIGNINNKKQSVFKDIKDYLQNILMMVI